MAQLSARQHQILEFLRHFLDEHDYPPTIRDIKEGCGLSSTSVVDYNLKRLEELGHIRRDREVSRGIEVVGHRGGGHGTVDVPVLGAIAAGQPIPVPTSDHWQTDVEDSITLTDDMVGGRPNIFALRVKGQSMIEDLIDDGDIVILEKVDEVRDGDRVAAWLKDQQEVTLKRFYHEGNRVRLQPANHTMDPIYTSPDNVEVQGRLVSVIRSPGA